MNKIKITGKLGVYLRFPLALMLILAAVNVGVYYFNVNAGLLMTIGLAVYFAILLVIYLSRKAAIFNEMITFAAQYGQIQKQILMDFSVPYALADKTGRILWYNTEFSKLTGKEPKKYQRSVTGIFSELSVERFPEPGQERNFSVQYSDKTFRVNIRSISIDPLIEESKMLESADGEQVSMYALFLHDETELVKYIQKYKDETLVVGLIYLDNYEEAIESVESVRRSLLSALLDQKISQYFEGFDALVKKYEKDKYLLVMRTKSLHELAKIRFPILEEIKTVNADNEMPITLSIGIGMNNGSYAKNAAGARSAIDLALGRGGDQVVLKDGDTYTYYGGKSRAVEKSTRVKARVKAQALREFISSRERVVVMGHKMVDVDSFGAAVGLYRAARTLNKKAHILIDDPTSSTRPFLEAFRQDTSYEPDMFLNITEAKEAVKEDTLLVVVDTSRASYVACEDLLYQTKTIVVLDHHRQGNDQIRNSVLSYIEPYASSSCEMVAEILQYFSDNVKLRNIEADALYAGIMIDTDNFLQKTGVRTFEAAAFLRRCGTDVTRVRKLFRENMNDYRTKGEVFRNAEMFRDIFVISECPGQFVTSPTIVGAQAANQLLNIIGVKASFVLTEYKGVIYISARAIDEINVQIIMEKMGGGGHLNMAGCQLQMSMQEAKTYLKNVLNEMMDGGELL